MMRVRLTTLSLACLACAATTHAAYDPTPFEQYEIEITNRLRLYPDGEVYRLRNETWGDEGSPQPPDLNEGITSNFLTDETRQPLTFNTALIQSARDYSATLLANDAFEHDYGDTSPSSRIVAAGYPYSGTRGVGENLVVNMSSAPLSITAAAAAYHHELLFIDGDVAGRGHRRNQLSSGWKEVGIGIAKNNARDYNYGSGNWYAVLSTQNFAYSAGSSGGKAFLTGVAFSDATTDNNFFDPGEELGGVTVTATPVGGGSATSTTTWGSGGYTLPLAAGTYNVVFSGGALAAPVTYVNVTIGATNVKLDASSDLGVWNVDADGPWTTAGNWSGAAANGVGRQAMFAGKATAPRTISLSSPQTVGGLSFNSAAAGYTIAGTSTLTLQLGGDRARAFDYAGNHTIATPVSLASGLDVTVLRAGDTLTFSSVISNPSAQSLVKLGKGALRLSGNNTLGGGVTVVDGTVYAGHNSALGTAAATLGFGSNDAALLADAAVTVPNAIQAATGPGGTRTVGTTLTAGTATFSGAVTLNHDLVVTAPAGGNVLLSQTVSGSSGLTKSGGGKVTLGLDAAYSGNTIVQAGTLELQNLANSASTTVNGLLLADSLRQTALTINAGGKTQILGSGTSVVNWLQIANNTGGFSWGLDAPALPAGASGEATAVPEPSSLLLILAALLALLARRCLSRSA